jgi:D-serine deaminase-like pyridoxal phosphate-dependent protein
MVYDFLHFFRDADLSCSRNQGELETAWNMVSKGIKLTLTIDSVSHVMILNDFVERYLKNLNEQSSSRVNGTTCIKFRVCIDVDVSYRHLNGLIHFGVHRSPIYSLNDFVEVLQTVEKSKHLTFVGVIAYEAHIARVPDAAPMRPLSNLFVRLFKRFATPEVRRKRQMIFELLKSKGKTFEICNGGGSGSLSETSTEPWLTEVTVGSSFLQSQLFDYYMNKKNEAAICFALRVTRIPETDNCVCQSGGFIASGEVSEDKQPNVFLPKGLKVYPHEGFGEVQTPFRIESPLRICMGDPIFCRPAKSGEIAEHFNDCFLLQNHKIIRKTKTYRGLGFTFY